MNTKQLFDRAAGMTRSATRIGVRLARRGASFAGGKAKQAMRSRPGPKRGMDDATLKSKVESTLFRPADAPKSSVSISVVNGVVQLRGQVKNPDQVKSLEAQAKAIPEVRDVQNLLHLPGTPAPTRTDTPASHRKRAARSGGA